MGGGFDLHWRSCLVARYMSGAAWRRMEEGAESGGSCSGSPTASGPSWALLRCTEPFSFHRTVGPPQTWRCYEPWGRPLPGCFFPQSFPLVFLNASLGLHLTVFHSYYLSNPPPLSWGTPPSQQGRPADQAPGALESPQPFDSMWDNMVNH